MASTNTIIRTTDGDDVALPGKLLGRDVIDENFDKSKLAIINQTGTGAVGMTNNSIRQLVVTRLGNTITTKFNFTAQATQTDNNGFSMTLPWKTDDFPLATFPPQRNIICIGTVTAYNAPTVEAGNTVIALEISSSKNAFIRWKGLGVAGELICVSLTYKSKQ